MKKRYLSILISVLMVAVLSIGQVAFAATLTGSTDSISVNGGAYIVQNNIWGASTAQTIDVNTSTGAFTVTRSDHNMPTNGAPASYPSIYKGTHWGSATTNSGMPIQVSNIGSCTSSWSFTTASGAWDAAYDIWFNTTPTTSGQPNGAELMIWANHQGGIQAAGSKVGTVTIGGASWDVWYKNVGWNYIAYVRTNPTNSVNLDLKAFYNDLLSRGYIQNSWYLLDVEAGFELWQGGTGMASNSFSVSVSSGSNPTPTPTPNATPTPNTTATPTPNATSTPTPNGPTPTPGAGGIKVQFYNGNTAATTNTIYPCFKLVNTGSSAVTLSNVKMRYFFTNDGTQSDTFGCDYAQAGSGNVTAAFTTISKTNADRYCEIGFTSGAGSLAAGAATEVKGRIWKSDWSNFTQTNDYSFNSSATNYVDWTKTTGYISGALKWGAEP